MNNCDESVEDRILSIKSRIEAFSKNGGLRHLQKEIERVNGNGVVGGGVERVNGNGVVANVKNNHVSKVSVLAN